MEILYGIKHERFEGDPAEAVTPKIIQIFPEYSVVDRSEYDTYDPITDRDSERGAIISFYTEKGQEEGNPRIRFNIRPGGLIRPGGFTFNYNNTPEPPHPHTVRLANNSFYAPDGNMWHMDDLEFALEKAKIHMDGVDHTDETFRAQLAGWSDVDQRFFTMGEKMDAHAAYKAAPKSAQGKMRKDPAFLATRVKVWDLILKNPSQAIALARERITARPQYTSFQGETTDTGSVLHEVDQSTDKGKQAVLRELYTIQSYESLLKVHDIVNK